MSAETPKVVETTPAPAAAMPVESTTTPAETAVPATTARADHTTSTDFTLGTTEPEPLTEGHATESMETTGATETAAAKPVTHATTDDAVVEAVPTTEGTLGYKAPGLLKQFRYVKHFFWLSDEPVSRDALDSYVKSEKAEVAHDHAAWARETGKGLMFFSKRAEDKATPSGIIILADATAVTKSGSNDFSFKADNHTHKFEAASSAERDSWVVAIEKIVEGSKGLKADITGRESYKHTLGDLSSHAASEGTHSTALKPDEPRTSIDAETARAAGPVDPINKAVNRDTSASSSDNEATRAKKADKKERSQSRKRSSVFGFFGKKDESDKKLEAEQEKELLKKHDHDAKKGDYEVVKKHDHDEAKKHDHEAKKREHEAKKRDHEAKKRDHEAAKEEKKLEAEHKKEMAKAEHDHSVAHETSEVAPVAAAAPAVVPVVATHADKNEEERTADKPVERLGEVTSPTEKKNKRASVFGGFFGKNKVTSPSSERSEKEVVPIVPVKDETPAVSETAPKLDEPIATKPLDTAAVTAPVDGTEPAAGPVAATTAEEPRSAELASPRETTLSPRSEKKSFLSGFMKKQDKREGAREEPMTNEEVAKEAVPVNAASESAVAEPATETPINEAEAREGRPAPEKRRTSIFGSLGTLKRKSDKSPGPSSVAADETKTTVTKREKSPMPSKLGGLFGKPSRAQNTTEGSKTDAPATIAQPEAATEAPTTIGETETPAETDVAKLHGETETVGDQVTSTFHDAVTNKPEETKSTA